MYLTFFLQICNAFIKIYKNNFQFLNLISINKKASHMASFFLEILIIFYFLFYNLHVNPFEDMV